jgi:SAM-dependent methyltransferase
MADALGQAIWDYHHADTKAKLWIHNKYGPKEDMPIDTYFRAAADMPPLEITALHNCRGKILDIGAGAGSHSLALQQMGHNVTAMDISPKAVEVMKLRGVKHALNADIFAYSGERYDTLLLLMNGIGLTGRIQGLQTFLQHINEILQPGGQLIFDSSDIAYLYEGNLPNSGRYYGEIEYEYRYKGKSSDWFSWLYIDKKTLASVVAKEGWTMEILFEDSFDQYLARLTYSHSS